MCGIVGVLDAYIDHTPTAFSDIVAILKRLEYRGYDSKGYYVTDWSSHAAGWSAGDETKMEGFHENYASGIGHTRWATHGEVNIENAHPHIGQYFVLVHNGIVTNYQKLAQDEQSDSVALLKRLDEVYGQFLSFEYDDEDTRVLDTLISVWQEVEGDNATLLIHQGVGNKIWYLTTGNRKLYCANNDYGQYISSDINSLSGLANKADVLSGVGSIGVDGYEFEEEVSIPQIDFSELGMFEEIMQQQELGLGDYGLRFKLQHIPLFVGCGSSYNAGLFGRRCFELVAKCPAMAEYASEFKTYSEIYQNVKPPCTMIGLSQSGETKDTIDAMGEKGFVITNNPSSTLAQKYHNVDLGCGLETGVAATKTFTYTCLELLKLSCELRENSFEKFLQTSIYKDALAEVFSYNELIKEFVDTHEFDRYLFLGSEFNYPIAREAALKMKEVSYIPAEGMPSAEMKHGPLALVDENCLSVFIMPDFGGHGFHKVLENIEEVRSRGSKIAVVGLIPKQEQEKCDLYCQVSLNITAGHLSTLNTVTTDAVNALSSILSVIPLQLLAYHTALKLGHNPDRPRNLAKTVTV